jgi:hypothetical protein
MSTATKPERRKLTFASLTEVVADAENLLAKGYDRAGNWDLAQVAGHLTEWMRYPLDGYPKLPLVIRPLFWLMRVTVGKKIRTRILTEGFRPGGPTMKQTVPSPNGDATAAVAKLKEVAERFKTHTGPLHPSPVFGAMDQDQWLRLQLRHCEHHLSFLVPHSS